MKKFYILLLSLFAINSLKGQSCLPEGIKFSRQAQIDSFKINYPGCKELEGNVTIMGYDDITNLNGLNMLTSIKGDLSISRNPFLVGLAGLDSITSIRGDLIIQSDSLIQNLCGLNSLTHIGGMLEIHQNFVLASLTGLTSINSIGGSLHISSNSELTSLTGLSNLTAVGGDLHIIGDPKLTSLTGFNSINSVGGSLHISSNSELTSLTGLNILTSVGGDLHIIEDSKLTNLTGLNALTTFGGVIVVSNNSSLTGLTGLENVSPNSINKLIINNNNSLSNCNVKSVCNYLASPNSITEFYNNAPGCNSLLEIATDCGITFPCLPNTDINFTTQRDIDNFMTIYPNCAELGGNVTISGNDIANLKGLGMLTSIRGDLAIYGNPILKVLTGLDSLNSIGGSLLLYGIDSLSNLTGLNSLNSIGGDLHMVSTKLLTSLEGLNALTSIGKNLVFAENESLTSFSGLNSLRSINGNFSVGSYYAFKPAGNPVLSSFAGLESLDSIAGNLEIRYDNRLTSLPGLEHLTYLGGSLTIGGRCTNSGYDAHGYPFCDNPNNPFLTSLSGIDNINAASLTNIEISFNKSLLTCDVQSICNFLVSPNGTVDIHDNAPGCNNPPEVARKCGITLSCLPKGNFYFNTQSDIDNFKTNYSGCKELRGNVRISGNDITNLIGLDRLTLTGGDLVISENPILTGLTGLKPLKSIKGNLDISWNPALSGLAGLDSITSIDGSLSIGGNYHLTSLTGLDALTHIGGHFQLGSNNWGDNGGNLALNSLSGLNSLISIGGLFMIARNESLINLTGLEKLTSIGRLFITGNTKLTSLTGLDNINTSSVTGIEIFFNSSLSSCEVQSICDYLAKGGYLNVQDNATGCNSQQEVEAACKSVGVESISDNYECFTITPNPSSGQFTINFTLDSREQVNLVVLNSNGQVMETLLDETVSAGEHKVIWNAKGLPTGNYYCRLQAGNQTSSGKMILME